MVTFQEVLSKGQLTAIISLVMILSGLVIVENIEKTFYCQPEDNTKECFKLGTNNTRCHYNTLLPLKYDVCTNGKWEKFEKFVKVQKGNIVQYKCDTKTCVQMNQ